MILWVCSKIKNKIGERNAWHGVIGRVIMCTIIEWLAQSGACVWYGIPYTYEQKNKLLTHWR